jgi:hypothetical protein
VLRGIFGPRRDKLKEGWRKLHNEELHDLYSLQSRMRVIKSLRMRWAWHVAGMGRREMLLGYWWKSQKKETTRKTKTR